MIDMSSFSLKLSFCLSMAVVVSFGNGCTVSLQHLVCAARALAFLMEFGDCNFGSLSVLAIVTSSGAASDMFCPIHLQSCLWPCVQFVLPARPHSEACNMKLHAPSVRDYSCMEFARQRNIVTCHSKLQSWWDEQSLIGAA